MDGWINSKSDFPRDSLVSLALRHRLSIKREGIYSNLMELFSQAVFMNEQFYNIRYPGLLSVVYYEFHRDWSDSRAPL